MEKVEKFLIDYLRWNARDKIETILLKIENLKIDKTLKTDDDWMID